MNMSQLHTAQEARQQHRSKDAKQRSQRQQRRQAAAASRDKAERRGSNVPRCAPSQAVLARKLTPLQRRPATRHLKEKNERHIHHMSQTNHISTHKDLQQHRYQTSCLDQQHSRACDICLNICHEHSTIAILQYI